MNIKKYIQSRSLAECSVFISIPVMLFLGYVSIDDISYARPLVLAVTTLLMIVFYSDFQTKKENISIRATFDGLKKNSEHNYGVAKKFEEIILNKNKEIQSEKNRYIKLKEIFDNNLQAAKNLEQKNSNLLQKNTEQEKSVSVYKKRIEELEKSVSLYKVKIKELEIKNSDNEEIKDEIARLQKLERKFKNSSSIQRLIMSLGQIKKKYNSHINFMLIEEMLLELENQKD